jgi:dihydrofolate reductase
LGKLIYLMNVSLDGFVSTVDGGLDWSTVNDEIHSFFNEQTRGLDASLYGRRLYETMSSHWPTAADDPNIVPVELEFAKLWNAMPKIVFSHSLTEVHWNSRLVRGDVADQLAQIRQEFSGDLDVGGATLAASFIEQGLVDEYRLMVHPVILGEGKPFFPKLDQPIRLQFVESRRFGSGHVYLRYASA